MNTIVFFWTGCALAGLLASAHPSYQDLIPNGDRVERGGSPWPGVGHLASEGGGARNTFGNAFAAAGHTWTTTLCNADTDGDGFTNGQELGDPACTWTPGNTPERGTGISHPGYADSIPLVTTPSYRLVGPNAYEGVLQGRVFPKAWGAVNFHSAASEWAREYCRALHLYNKTDFAAAFFMADRPASDQQYLPPDAYVSISDVTGCGSVDMATCAFQYSDVGSPQNTTAAATHGIYVDCRYNAKFGLHPEYLPVRLTGPVPGRGELQVYLKENAPTWVLSRVFVSPALPQAAFVCEHLMGYDPTAFTPVYVQGAGGNQIRSMPVSIQTFKSPDERWNSTFEYMVPGYTYPWQKYTCATDTNPRGYTGGPAMPEFVAQIEAGHTPTTFAALVASTYGINSADVVTRYWNDTAAFASSYVAVHIKSSASTNQGVTIDAMATTDAATFGVIEARVEHADDPLSPAGFPSFMIDGPVATKGVLKARYGADPWGHVQWHASIENAKDICALAGVSTTGFIPNIVPVTEEPLASSYMVADGYIAVSDPGTCLDEQDLNTCPFVYSPHGTHRNATNITKAVWIDCQWSSYPDVRLVQDYPCSGVIEARMPGTDRWVPAWTDFSADDMCQLAGCPCTGTCYYDKLYNKRFVELFLHTCDISTSDRSACLMTNHDPPVKYADQKFLICQTANAWYYGPYHNNPPNPGLRDRRKSFVLNSSMTPAMLPGFVASMYNVSADDFIVLNSIVNETTELSHFLVRMRNDDPHWGPLDRAQDWVRLGDYGLVDSDAVRENNKLIYAEYPDPDPGPFEYRLNGPSESRGMVQIRALNGANKDWGYMQVNHHSFGTTDFGDRVCRSVGQYRADRMSLIWRQGNGGGVGADLSLTPDGPTYWPGTSCRVTQFDWSCASWGEYLENCSYSYNDKTHNQGCIYSVMVDCASPVLPMRLVGAFPGVGWIEIKYEDGTWYEVGHNDVPNHCKKWLHYPENPAWTPIRTLEPTSQWGNAFYLQNCPDPTEYPKCAIHFKGSGGNMNHYVANCVEPPSTIPFGGASITQLNAAITINVINVALFRTIAAEVAGVTEPEIIISQWNDQQASELTYLTISINNTGINVGVALNAIAANGSVPWLYTDVRQMPVPTGVPAANWDWGMELVKGPKHGFVVARPTAHYQYGVPCAAKWTVELSKTFCATMFGAGVLTWPRDPTFQAVELANGGVRNMYLEEVLCAPGATDIKTCSYAFAQLPTAQCPGTANILVDCQPTTGTETHSPTASATASLSASVTPSLSRSRSRPTVSRSRTRPTASPSVSPSLTTSRSVSPSPSRSVPPTPSVAPTRTPDMPTPAPPTPAPPRTPTPALTRTVSLLPIPTPVPPPPPPTWGVHIFVTGGLPPLPLRPGVRVAVGVTLEMLHATPLPAGNASSAAEVQVRLTQLSAGRGLTLVPAPCADSLPPQCTVASHDPIDVTCVVPASPSGLTRWSTQLPVAVVVGVFGANETTLQAELSAPTWTTGFTESAQYPAEPAASATIRVRHATGEAPIVVGAIPALNALEIGSPLQLWGHGLRALPAAVPVGPWLPVVDASADGRSATVTLPSWDTAPDVMIAIGAAVVNASNPNVAAGAALMSWHEREQRQRHLACHVLRPTSIAAIASGAAEWHAMPPPRPLAALTALLRRFDVSLEDAQVSLLPPPAARPTDEVPIGMPDAPPIDSTDPPAPVEQQPTTLATWLPSCNVSGSVVADVQFVAGNGNTTYHAAALLNVSGSDNDDDAAASCNGTWATFEFPPTLTEALIRVANTPTPTSDDGDEDSDDTPSNNTTASTTRMVIQRTGNSTNEDDDDPTTGTELVVTPVGPGTVTLVVTVRDPARLTVSRDTRTFVVPAIAASVASSGRYRARIRLWAARAAVVRNVRLLAYTDRELSVRPFPVRSTSSACVFDATNVSCACARSELLPRLPESTASRRQQSLAVSSNATTSDGPWDLEIFAPSAPGYFTGRIVAWVHVRSSNAPAFHLAVELTPDNATRIALPTPATSNAGANRTASGDASGGSLGGGLVLAPPTAAPGPAPGRGPVGVAPNGTAAPTPTTAAPPALGQALVRGIFGYTSSCDGTKINFLAATLLAFAILLVLRLVVTFVLRRREAAEADRHVTTNVPALPALLRVHLYAGAAVPCHHYCGPAHTVQLLAHALSLYAIAAAFVNAYPELASDAKGTVALGALTALVAAIGQPVVALPFTLYRVVDTRREPLPQSAPYAPHDLERMTARRPKMVGVGVSTLTALDAVAYDRGIDGHLGGVQDIEAPHGEGTAIDEWAFDPIAAYGDDGGDGARPSSVNAKAAVDMSPYSATLVPKRPLSSDSQGPTEEDGDAEQTPVAHGIGTSSSDDHHSVTTVIESSTQDTGTAPVEPRTCKTRDVQTCVVVDSFTFSAVGYAFAVFFGIALAMTVASATAAWCAAEMALFRDVVLIAAAADIIGVQALVMGATAAWRWLTSEEDPNDGDSASDEDDETAVSPRRRTTHELHPIDGQWRYVGALRSAADVAADMEEEDTKGNDERLKSEKKSFTEENLPLTPPPADAPAWSGASVSPSRSAATTPTTTVLNAACDDDDNNDGTPGTTALQLQDVHVAGV